MTAGADEVRQEKRQLEAERLQRACAADICEAMENAAARRVLLRILRYTGVVVHDVSTFDKNALVMAQNEGIQRVGRWLLSEISFSTPTWLFDYPPGEPGRGAPPFGAGERRGT